MGEKLLPLSLPELCAHALALERDAAMRFRDYAKRMRELGFESIALEFEALRLDEEREARALQAAGGEYPPAELSPWEHAWRLTYLPDGSGDQPHAVPQNAPEALRFAVLAKRRAEIFYRDVADHARDQMVRNCAAEMASAERRQIQLLERLLGGTLHDPDPFDPSGDGDAHLPR